MLGTGIAGPIFVSIGDPEKLQAFLDKNPYIDPNQALVDGYDFEAYKAAGFGRFDEQDKDLAKEGAANIGAPTLGLEGWWNYMTSVMKVSPIPPDMKFGDIPEGVLRLGGTYVVQGDQILYRWSDRVPGDHPDIEEVMKIAKDAAAKPKSVSFGGFELPNFFAGAN